MAVGLVGFAARAVEIVFSDDPSLGVNALPAERNRWRSKVLHPVEQPKPSDYVALDKLDFFRAEYGHPAEAFDFSVGREGTFSKLYGAKAFDDEATGVRVGRGWGALGENHARLEFEVAGQNVEETDWQVVFHGRQWAGTRKDFKLKNGANRIPLGVIGTRYASVFGLEFICTTKGAKGRVKSLRFVPEELPTDWRSRFRLKTKPVKAGISFVERPNYTLTVNGRKVCEGGRILFNKVRKVDLTGLLRAGENTVVFSGNWGGGYDGGKTLKAELFAVGPDGRTTFAEPTSWESRFGAGAWRPCFVGDDIGIDTMPNGRRIADGSLPLHAGPLTVAPKNPDGSIYPVFDYDGPITWTASVPSALASGGSIVATVNGREYAVRKGRVDFAGLPTGAYEIEWTFRRGGRVVDTDRTEMIVAGPLPGLDEVQYQDFERTLAARKRLLQEVDCTREERNPTNFIDHTGPYGEAATGVGRVTSAGGLAFRETGAGNGDFFGYKLKTGARGKAHILEVDVPDVREQVLYIQVAEPYPVPFCNNGLPLGSRGWPNATGAAACGGAFPLSGGKKTVTVVFFPGSDNATVCFENGLANHRAGVIGWRLYEVPEGLPALKIPKTDRLYANHNERIIFNNWGAHENPRIQEYARDGFDGCWRAAYAGIANRISYLKFAGHNAALEGAYMYNGGFPSESGRSGSCAEEFDCYYAMAKLYRHNRIRLIACFEYLLAPDLVRTGAFDVGDAEVRAGTKRSFYSVDRHGRQVASYLGNGLNYLNPKVRASINGLVREIYRRYGRTKAIEALWMVNGFWWMPGLPMLTRQTASDVGYDDDSIEQFQQDTGLDLGLPWKGAERFPARHRLLNGKYKTEWYAWRAKRLRQAVEEIRRIVTSEREQWEVFAVPDGEYDADHPFRRADATEQERDGFMGDYLRRTGFDPDLYGKGSGAKVRLVPSARYERARTFENEGILANRGSRALYRRNDALYFRPVGLNERPCNCPKAKAWWWQTNAVAVYDVKPIGENAFCDLVDVIDEYAPKCLFHTWTDVNVTTAFTEEARRFLTGFYATPCGDPVPFGGIRGVTANRYGPAVQLVNDTPYSVAGELTATARTEDVLTGRRFTGTIPYSLPPFGVTVLRTVDPEKTLSGRFAFDAKTSEAVRARVRSVTENRLVAARVSAARRTTLAAALRDGDDYAAMHCLRDWEVQAATRGFFETYPGQASAAAKTARPAARKLVEWQADAAPLRLRRGESKFFAPATSGQGPSSGAITLSLLVKASGTDGALMFGFPGMRFDLCVAKGKVSPAIVGFPPQKTFFTVRPDESRPLVAGWHHISYRVDPAGEASVWVDGERLVTEPFAECLGGTPLPSRTNGGLRVDFYKNAKFTDDCLFELRHVTLREGLLTGMEIQSEAADWMLAVEQTACTP